MRSQPFVHNRSKKVTIVVREEQFDVIGKGQVATTEAGPQRSFIPPGGHCNPLKRKGM